MHMRNPKNVLNSLSIHSKDKNFKFERLYRILYNEEMYLQAYQNIYANEGNMTKGSDGKTIDGMSMEWITILISAMKDESYQPVPSRRTYIKKKNGKMRPLGIPAYADKLVQEIVRMILEAIYEGYFEATSHGFRPNKSCHSALLQIQKKFTGTKWFIEGDIKGFFDNISHSKLIEILRRRISDERFIRLIWKFLKAGYLEEWQFHNTYSGTPQGGIISPILANIYLDELDKFMKDYAQSFNRGKERRRNTEYRKLEVEHGKLVKALKVCTDEAGRKRIAEAIHENEKIRATVPYGDAMDEGYRRIQYVRYADDFLIGVIGTKADCQKIKEDIRVFLDERELELSDEKTLITNAQKRAHFLGYDIRVRNCNLPKRDREGRLKRDYTGRIVLEVPMDKIKSKLLDLKVMKLTYVQGKEVWKATARYAMKDSDDLEILDRYNSEIRGFYNYYSIANNSSIINSFYYMMQYSMYKTYGTKYRTSIHKIIIKFRIDKEFGVKFTGKNGKENIRLFYHEGFKRKTKALDSSCDVVIFDRRYLSRTSLLDRIKSNRCELCGAENVSIEMHHIRKLKDLKGKDYWEQLMIARKRKTMAVCHNCHLSIHHGKIN